MTYKEEIIKAMKMLAQDERTIFLGQSIAYEGNAIYKTLLDIPKEKKIEMPVAEDMQMGMSTGLSLKGFIPVSIFPRMDFITCATNQLVNHLDKIKEASNGHYNPKVIIRVATGSKFPLYPGVQHCSDYTEAYKVFLKNVDVVKLEKSSDIFPAYKKALESDKSTMLIENPDLYGTE